MDEYENAVTIGLVTYDRAVSVENIAHQVGRRHDGPHDLILVAVPPGKGRAARDRIWEALDTTPVPPSPSEGTLAATSADQDYIRRAYVGP